MLRSFLKFGFLLVVGILIYNYFFGTSAEKAQSKKIFGQTKELFVSARDLVKSERSKFNDGKYDNAVAKVKSVFGNLRETAKDSKDVLAEIDELDAKRKRIEERLAKIKSMPDEIPDNYSEFTEKGAKKPAAKPSNKLKPNADKSREEKNLESELDDLMNRTNTLMDKIEKEHE